MPILVVQSVHHEHSMRFTPFFTTIIIAIITINTKISIIILLALIITTSLVLALPAEEVVARGVDPPNVPVTVLKPLKAKNFVRGGEYYVWDDICNAVAWGVLLKDVEGKCPRPFENDNNEVPLFAGCRAGDPNSKEYLLFPGTSYNGGNTNRNPGTERFVYLHHVGEVDRILRHPLAIFCAFMTHVGAAQTKFLI
ncbi:hypothetical protein BJ546DRAFT_1064514 [Cryomyces antarcticus]